MTVRCWKCGRPATNEETFSGSVACDDCTREVRAEMDRKYGSDDRSSGSSASPSGCLMMLVPFGLGLWGVLQPFIPALRA